MRDKILAMEAGRDLDALVIDKMEFELNTVDEMGHWVYLGNNENPVLFRPSENVRDAWLVAEKFKLSGFLINHLNNNPMGDGWHCVINHEHHARGCKTAPEAICKAALFAVIES